MKTEFFLTALILFATIAQADEFDAMVLQGIKGAGVVIEDPDPEANKLGISKAVLKAQVELRLRQNGIKIEPGGLMPHLYLSVSSAWVEELGHFVYSIELSVKEGMRLPRNGQLTLCRIWTEHRFGVSHKNTFPARVKTSVDNLLTLFLNDYLTANPKEPASR